MSVSASIDITFFRNEKYNFSVTDFIDAMLSQDWKIEKNGKVCFLPLGDNDMFEWLEIVIDEEELKKIIRDKENQKEIIGIDLYWQDTDRGVSALIFQDYQISFNLNINRVKVDELCGFDMTDVSWYFLRLLPCFQNEMFKIEEVKFSQNW